eukprot:CFRG5917T1
MARKGKFTVKVPSKGNPVGPRPLPLKISTVVDQKDLKSTGVSESSTSTQLLVKGQSSVDAAESAHRSNYNVPDARSDIPEFNRDIPEPVASISSHNNRHHSTSTSTVVSVPSTATNHGTHVASPVASRAGATSRKRQRFAPKIVASTKSNSIRSAGTTTSDSVPDQNLDLTTQQEHTSGRNIVPAQVHKPSAIHSAATPVIAKLVTVAQSLVRVVPDAADTTKDLAVQSVQKEDTSEQSDSLNIAAVVSSRKRRTHAAVPNDSAKNDYSVKKSRNLVNITQQKTPETVVTRKRTSEKQRKRNIGKIGLHSTQETSKDLEGEGSDKVNNRRQDSDSVSYMASSNIVTRAKKINRNLMIQQEAVEDDIASLSVAIVPIKKKKRRMELVESVASNTLMKDLLYINPVDNPTKNEAQRRERKQARSKMTEVRREQRKIKTKINCLKLKIVKLQESGDSKELREMEESLAILEEEKTEYDAQYDEHEAEYDQLAPKPLRKAGQRGRMLPLEDKQAAMPEVRFDENGEIVVDMESLHSSVVDGTFGGSAPQNIVYEDDESVHVTYHSYANWEKTDKWSKEDTEAFYDAIKVFGSDFSFIHTKFPDRSRGQVRNKFKREEKVNGKLIDSLLKEHVEVSRRLTSSISSLPAFGIATTNIRSVDDYHTLQSSEHSFGAFADDHNDESEHARVGEPFVELDMDTMLGVMS